MRLIIFDLDGTLVDSLPDLVHAVNAAMAEYGFPAVSAAQVVPWIGRGSRVLLESALRHHGLNTSAADFDFDVAFARFMEHYGRHLTGDSRLYPDVAATLERLIPRYTLAVCTNKPSRFVAPLLEHFGIRERFSALVGGDSLSERKPSPAPLLYLARHFGVEPADCAMVGDSTHDVQAARAAGMTVAGMRHGYRAPGDFGRCPPDIVLETMADLPRWLDRLPETA
jgi:phosphoglycolate phosphatase